MRPNIRVRADLWKKAEKLVDDVGANKEGTNVTQIFEVLLHAYRVGYDAGYLKRGFHENQE